MKKESEYGWERRAKRLEWKFETAKGEPWEFIQKERWIR
jgi:hypothetical protein